MGVVKPRVSPAAKAGARLGAMTRADSLKAIVMPNRTYPAKKKPQGILGKLKAALTGG